MSPSIKSYFVFLLLIANGWGIVQSQGQGAEPWKIMHYNLLRFGNDCEPVSINQKAAWLGTILNFYQPDLFTVNELVPEEAFEALIEQAAQSYNPAMEAAGFTNESGSEIVNDLFYNSDRMGLKSIEVLPGAFRDINIYTLYVKDNFAFPNPDTVFIPCIVAHFKAGREEEDRLLRIQEAKEVLSWLNAGESTGNILFMGDLNFDNAGEEGWELLVNPDSGSAFIDPINLTEDWNGPNFASVHTQSTRTTTPDCGVEGGLDDRFDFILLGPQSGETSFSYVPDSYQALGNNGSSFNEALACGGGEVPEIICNTLRNMSDHLPVVLEVEMGEPVSNKVLLDEQLIVYSNPLFHTLQIRLKEEISPFPLHISLTNIEGKEIFHSKYPSESLLIDVPVEFLPAGFYALKLSTREGQFWVGKVLKR